MSGWHTKVLLVCCLLFSGASSISYNEKVIADQLKIDSTWISDRAQEMVDIIFVMDWSLSVGSQRFNETKEFVRNFLDYFSIATLHAQVGVILFADKLRYPIPLINHNNKCQFMKQLDAVPINTELWTDVYSGINKAWTILKTGSGLSRRGFGASGVAVLITDGYWNKGGDPGPIIKKMKKDNILVIVITVGNFGNDKAKQNEMLRWASFDNRKKRMAFPVENFNKFAEIGYYIHKGSHASKYLPIDPSKCSSTCLKPAKCMCDSLGNRGAPECACPAGKHIKPVANGKSCTSCPIGYYHEEASNILTECKHCPNRQTTLSRGSVDKRQCVCQLGYWNAQDQTRSPPCSGQKTGAQYPCETTKCGEDFFTFPIGTSDVRFIAEDRSGNKADCDFQAQRIHFHREDIESPTVVQCDGPVKDSSGFIYSDQQEADVQWKLPEFSDNSGEAVEMFSTGTPGTYRVGRTWTITYTAKDKAGNTAKCEFSFKLSGIRCPTLHVPASGALVCDSLAFGVYCVPHCEKGLTRLLPDYVRRQPADYFCTTRGTWLPHADVGDCAIPTPVTADTIAQYEFTWYEGNCNDEQTQKTIMQNTIDALDAGGPSFVGQGFKADQDGKLTVDDFVVFCGAKNESIVQIQPGGSG